MRPHHVLLFCVVAVAMLVAAAYWRQAGPREVYVPADISGPSGDRYSVGNTSFDPPNEAGPYFQPRTLDRIDPGTRIADSAPDGWTHLIFKSKTQLHSGAVDALPDFARRLAEFIFTAMLARVVRGEDGVWRLDNVALGVGTTINGEDVIVSRQTQKQLGANLGAIQTTVLAGAEERLDKLERVAATESMMVVDTPTIYCFGEENRETVFRYLFLLDPRTGGLATIVWRIDIDDRGRYLRVGSEPILMTPDQTGTAKLHVDGSKIVLGIPSHQAFAGTQMPDGITLSLPPEVATIAAQKPLSHAGGSQLEAAFRAVLQAMRGK